ncbi:MAG: hypothetical protein GY884_13820 [Proteobacteria bacterium]|nr:hypothetical protein [Pseudomonadota bacterium]
MVLESIRILDNTMLGKKQALGLIHTQGSTVDMYNVLIAGNTLSHTDGSAWVGGTVFSSGSTTYAENVSIVGNIGDPGTDSLQATGWYTYSSADVVEFVNVDISHNQARQPGRQRRALSWTDRRRGAGWCAGGRDLPWRAGALAPRRLADRRGRVRGIFLEAPDGPEPIE